MAERPARILAAAALLLLAACDGTGETDDRPVHALVSLSWGGAGAHAWEGTWRVRGARVEPEWIWLADFEPGDRYAPGPEMPRPRQQVPPGYPVVGGGAVPEVAGLAPGVSALQTWTDGDGDGLRFETRGPASARVELELGPGKRLEVGLGDLLAAPHVVRVAGGAALVARAVDLACVAPESRAHRGVEARRASLHTHSCFSTNRMTLEPVAESLAPFVRRVWWTDHNLGEGRGFVGGDFEDPEVARALWTAEAAGARVLEAAPSADAFAGQGGFRLRAAGRGPGLGFAWISLQGGKGAGELDAALPLRPTLAWAWRAEPGTDGSPSRPFVRVRLHSGRELRYVTELPPDAPAEDFTLLDPPEGGTPGGWWRVERDLLADAERRFTDLGTDAVLDVELGLLLGGGEEGSVCFDELELDCPAPEEQARIQLDALAAFPDVDSLLGIEDSAWRSATDFGALFPHLTALLPQGRWDLFPDRDAEPTAAERRAWVGTIHEAGGAVGVHHVHIARQLEPFLDGAGLGADLFEVGGAWHTVPQYATAAELAARDGCGYPELVYDELFPQLVRYDRALQRGLVLTLYGAPDMHNRFDRPSGGFMNRWLTWILAEADTVEASLRALRRGQASACDWRTDAVVDLTVEGRPWMGRVVVTDRAELAVAARVSGALPGSTLRWIGGELVAAADEEPAPARVLGEVELERAELETPLALDPRTARFVRAELRDPTGAVVALSNPVVLTPGWPDDVPFGRLALDWRGVAVEGEVDVALHAADVRDGVLHLSGESFGPAGELRLAGSVARVSAPDGARVELGGDGTGARVRGLPRGPFELVVTPAERWDEPPRTRLLRLPRRKELLLAIDVGVPGSEHGRVGSGFEDPVRDPVGLIDHRMLPTGRGTFRLPVPIGEPSFVRLVELGYSGASGRLLVDGEPLGAFAEATPLTFEVPAAEPGAQGTRERTFELELLERPMALRRIELWGGPGVVDY